MNETANDNLEIRENLNIKEVVRLLETDEGMLQALDILMRRSEWEERSGELEKYKAESKKAYAEFNEQQKVPEISDKVWEVVRMTTLVLSLFKEKHPVVAKNLGVIAEKGTEPWHIFNLRESAENLLETYSALGSVLSSQ